MKKMFTLLALVIAVVMTSCEEYDGRWKPIEVDKSQLSFTPEGGWCKRIKSLIDSISVLPVYTI